MKKCIYLILTTLMVFTVSVAASAQTKTGGNVTVQLIDASNNEPVGFATVSVTAKGASDPLKYTLTNEKGSATIEDIKNGTYTFKADMMGYKPYSKEITIKNADVALGQVKLDVDQELLDAASVQAIGAPVTIKKDTIEYNASAFKTIESDVLEDLLKKLPGVEVGDDGSITVNGQSVTKVYIDGKTFFMDDPQIASKNLPAKLIQKVKVVQKKSEQAEFTGIDDGEEETVLDLSVEPGMMKGIVGNVTAGIGHDFPADDMSQAQSLTQAYDDHRFQDNLFLGKFTDNRQLAIIGNANNANSMGFGGGNFGGGGRGGFGGSGGITTSYMLGANLGTNFFDDKMEFSGNYMFNGMDNESKNLTNKRTHLLQGEGDSASKYDLVSDTESTSFNNNMGHSFGLRIEHEFSKSSSLIFEPQISYNWGGSGSTQIFDTQTDYLNGTVTQTNDGFSANSTDNKSISTSGMLMYRQRIAIPGRTLTARVRYELSNTESNGFNQSLTNSYLTGKSVAEIINQRNAQTSQNYSVNANINYTEPLGNFFYVEANYGMNWRKQYSEKNVFTSGNNDLFPSAYTDKVTDAYINSGEVYDPDYSNTILNESMSNSFGVNLLYQGDNLHAQVGARLRPTKTHNETTKSSYQIDTTFTVFNWAPEANIIWDATDNLNFRMFYRGESEQPSISQLMPVPDNSNPLRVSLGNPSLAPYFSHNVNGDIRYNNRQRFSSVNVRFNAGMVDSPIVNAIITTNGVQHTIPFNGPNSYNASMNVMTNNPLFTDALTLSTMTGVNGNQSTSFTGNNVNINKYYKEGSTSDFDYDLFLSDYEDIASSKDFTRNTTTSLNVTERINLSFRADDFDFRIGGSTRYQRAWYSISDAVTNTWNNSVNASFTWNWEAPGLSFDTDVRYQWYNGYDTNPESTTMWNMEIEKFVFNRKGTLALRAYDILGQTVNFTYTVDQDYTTESLSNSLGRYVIVAFSYRFGNMGGRNGRMSGNGRGNRGGMGGMSGMSGMGGMGGMRGSRF